MTQSIKKIEKYDFNSVESVKEIYDKFKEEEYQPNSVDIIITEKISKNTASEINK